MNTTSSQAASRGAIGACVLLWASSYLVPVVLLPIAVFVSLWLAVLVWGIVLSGTGQVALVVSARSLPILGLPLLGLGVMAACASAKHDWTSALMLLAAAAIFLFGAVVHDERWLRALQVALLVAGALSVVAAALQLVAPLAEIPGVAPSAAGRAAGNLHQPNLLAQLLLQAIVALMALTWSLKKVSIRVGLPLALLLGMGLSFSQSRTGWLGMGLLLVWVLMDRSMPKEVRRLTFAAVVGCALGMGLVLLSAEYSGIASYVEKRSAAPDISSSRFGIWSNTLELIGQNVWTGVGWGQFAKAWALTPFPSRPIAAFDNAHNLPLHLMVELGVPLALVLMVALGWVVWRSLPAASLPTGGAHAPAARCALAALLLLAVHSLLEYPLWFSFFLLPAAFFLGHFIRLGRCVEESAPSPGESWPTSPIVSKLVSKALKACGVLIVLGSLYAAWDYSRVLQAFKPFGPGLRKTLEQRVAEGRKGPLFGYWVDFGVVTNAEHYENLTDEVQRAFRHRVNPRMLMIYAKYLHERGEDDKASYVAARLREFRNPVSTEFFAACGTASPSVLFQCRPPVHAYTWRDFR